ncbi:MAG: TetR family transcriptional regulator [Caulobacterales bacterium]|nr:TetR family transcriptional regulator [Caulobacterales bacterium]
MERLLQVSAELLEEVGVNGFNTNLLAQRAGVAVRAIYRYFPNKWAILVAMAERASALERTWIGDLRSQGDGDWRADVDRAIDGYYEAARRHRGYAALRAASQASPELRAVDDRSSRELQMDLAAGLRELGVTVDDLRLQVLCLSIIETANRLLDIALQSEPQTADLLVAELKRMLVGLLQQYLPT